MRFFKLPDLGEGLHEAEIVEWHVAEGDEVKADQLLVSVETAKAIVDVPSPCDGKLARLMAKAGDNVHTGEPLVEFEGAEDADAATVVGTLESGDEVATADDFIIGSPEANLKAEIKAAPQIRELARQLGVNLDRVRGSGSFGNISRDDVEAAALPNWADDTTERLRGVGRTMAKNMSIAHSQVVKVTLHDDADLYNWQDNSDATMRVVRAIGVACAAEPGLNCWFDGVSLRRKVHPHVDLGIAVDTPDGLFVPVLRDIRNRSAKVLRAGLDQLRKDVQARKIPPAELQGATISLSNFGTMAGRYADPVVVPPMVSIVGTGRIRSAVVAVEEKAEIHRVMPLSLSFDHRVVTGGEAARFLGILMQDLEKSH